MNVGARMTVCNSGHDEICYLAKDCPLCATLDELGRVTDERNALRTSEAALEHADVEWRSGDGRPRA